MFSARRSESPDGAIRFSIDTESGPISYADALHGWQQDPGFRDFFNALLDAAPFRAFRWETPAVTSDTLNRPFEFVLVDSPYLDTPPDPAAFHEHLCGQAPESVVEFANLGGDAILVVPCPRDASSDYAHLGAWLRNASEVQRHALWCRVGGAMQRRISTSPVWLSTAGGGVDWLHVRLDDRPKYYAFAPYRDSL